MDSAHNSKRAYPSYTLAELRAFVAAGRGNAVMLAEIAARESDESQVFSTPQLDGGKVQTRLGRM